MKATPSNEPPAVAPGRRPPNWVERHPVLFVTLITLVMLIGIGAFLGMFFGMMKASGAYQGALARAQAAPEVAAVLGSPIKPGFLTTGSINLSGPSGHAELSIPIAGPEGKARIYLEANKRLGEWHLDRMYVQVAATGERIDLSEQPAAP